MKLLYSVGTFILVSGSTLLLTGCNSSDIQDEYNPTPEEVEAFENHGDEEHGEGHEYVNAEQLAEYDSAELSDQEISDLLHMRQEEKMARDVYRTLGKTYAINQFKNIPLSEQKHTDAMELLLERYDIPDPILNESEVGTYKDEKFVTLYQDLTKKGETSLVDALLVGATIEDINMAKLLEVIENTDNEDLAFVYQSVLGQSHNHMRAFIKNLSREGETYTPEHITQEYFDEVVQS